MTLPRLLIFDLDGTLIDSAGDIHVAVNRMLDERGQPPLALAEVRGMIGEGAPRLIERALAARPAAAIEPAAALARFLAHYEADATALTRPFPGVPETLEALAARGHTLAVSTNKPERASRRILDALGLAERFASIVGGDSHPFRKPDPRMLTGIAASLGLDDLLLIGDSEIDSATAAAAGAPFVLMTYGYRRGPVEAIPCRAALDRFDALLGKAWG